VVVNSIDKVCFGESHGDGTCFSNIISFTSLFCQ